MMETGVLKAQQANKVKQALMVKTDKMVKMALTVILPFIQYKLPT